MTARAQQLAVDLRDVPLDADSGRHQSAGTVLPIAWLEAIAEHLVDELGWIPPESYVDLERHRDELEAAVDRVRRLHDQDESFLARGAWCPGCGEPEPCKTQRALAGPTAARPPG